MKKKICPFKIVGYKPIVDYFTEMKNIIKAGKAGAIYGKPRDACNLPIANPRFDDCVGEEKCLIIKKIGRMD